MLYFAEAGFIGIYYFLPIYFIKTLGFDVLDAGMIVACFGVGTIIGGFVGGRLSDIFSPARICAVSLLLQAFIFFFLLQCKSFLSLSSVLFFMGFCSYAFVTANHLWVLERCGENEEVKLKALNILNVASNLSLSISAIIMGFFVNSNFNIMVEAGSVVLFLLACYILFFANIGISSFKKIADPAIIPMNENQPINILLGFVLICSFLMGFIIFQNSSTYSIYLINTFPALGAKSFSILLTINCLMVVFLQTPLVNIVGKYNKLFMMGIGAFFIGFGTALLIISFTFLIAICSCVIYTLGEMIFCALAQLICYQSSATNRKGTVMGLYRMIFASSKVAAPAIGGMVYQKFGGNSLWLICGCLGTVVFISATYLKNDMNFRLLHQIKINAQTNPKELFSLCAVWISVRLRLFLQTSISLIFGDRYKSA